MSSKKDLLDRGLGSIDPIGREHAEPRLSDPSVEELLQTILASDPLQESEEGGFAPARGGRAWRRRALAPALVGVLAAFAIVVGLPGGSGENGGGAILPALAKVAAAAAAQPVPDTALPFLFMKTRATYVDTSEANGQAWSDYRSEIDEEWIAADGSGRLRRIEAPIRFVSPRDREAWEAADKIDFLAHGFGEHVEERDLPAGHFDDELPGGGSISDLPTDPGDLARWLTQRAEDPAPGGAYPISVKTLALVAEILQNPLATPELRAALYEAEEQIPGVEYLGPATDEIGRRGVAVGARSANSGAPTLYSMIFDPTTSQVLATVQTITEPPAALSGEPTPLVTATKVFVSSGRTASLTAVPSASSSGSR
jgi:hypothetical protein